MAAVLDVPHHGCLRLPDAGDLCLCFLAQRPPHPGQAAVVAASGAVQPAAALDCHRGRLVLRRVRASALGHRRDTADQPGGVLPDCGEVLGTLAAIVVLYSIFLIIEVWLMVRFARKGPSSLHTGRYDLETGKLKEA